MSDSGTKSKPATWSDRRVLDETAARQFGYSILRRAYIESPNLDFIDTLRSEGMLDAIPFQAVNESVAAGVETIRNHLEADGGISEEGVFEIGDDYMQLFVGPGKLPAPPWEAIYRSEKRRVFQKETVEVRRCYEAYKLQPEKYKREPDDHIALELDFMSRLCDFFIDAIKDKKYTRAKKILKSQIEFLDLHMLLWVAKFCDDVRLSAQTDFYKGMTDLVEGYLVQDREYLGALMESIGEKIKAEKARAAASKPGAKGDGAKAASKTRASAKAAAANKS